MEVPGFAFEELSPTDLGPFFKTNTVCSYAMKAVRSNTARVCFVFVFKVENVIFHLTNDMP